MLKNIIAQWNLYNISQSNPMQTQPDSGAHGVDAEFIDRRRSRKLYRMSGRSTNEYDNGDGSL